MEYSEDKRREQAHNAEQAVIDFFQSLSPDITVRPATKKEDAGYGAEFAPKIIDQVLYLGKKPAMAPQVTTAEGRWAMEEKMQEMRDKPFVRLDEMDSEDVAIPRTITKVGVQELERFMQDPDFNKHPKLSLQILDSTLKSLQYGRLMTKNPKEINNIETLIQILDKKRAGIETKLKGKTN